MDSLKMLIVVLVILIGIFFALNITEKNNFSNSALKENTMADAVGKTTISENIKSKPSDVTSSDIKDLIGKFDTTMIQNGAKIKIKLGSSIWIAQKINGQWDISSGDANSDVTLNINKDKADQILSSKDLIVTLKALNEQNDFYASEINVANVFTNGIVDFAQKYELI